MTKQLFSKILPLFLIVAGFFAFAAPAYAQCANGYTNSIGDRICGAGGGGGGGGAAVTPGISGANRSPPVANGGPVYIPTRLPPDGPPFPYTEAEVADQFDRLEAATVDYTEDEMGRAGEILEGMGILAIMAWQDEINQDNPVSFDGTLSYNYIENLFMGQSVTAWSQAQVNTVLSDASAVMDSHFTAAEIAAANAILGPLPLDQIMEYGGNLAINNPLSFDIGMTGGGSPLNLLYNENSFMGTVVSTYTEAQVNNVMGNLTDILDGFSPSEVLNATDGVLAGLSVVDIMEYPGPLNVSTATTFTLATNSLGDNLTFDFLENVFMGTTVTDYTTAQVQTQMTAITGALAGFTDVELATVEAILDGLSVDDIMNYAGPWSQTATTSYTVATDSGATPITFDFNSQTFMGTPVTAHDPVDVQTQIDAITAALTAAALSDADLATVQTALDGMTIDDLMAYSGPIVGSSGTGGTTYQVATYSDGITPVTFDSGVLQFMGTNLAGSIYTPAQIQTVADTIALEIAGAPDAALAGIEGVLSSVTLDEIMTWAGPYVFVDVWPAPPPVLAVNVGYFMGVQVYMEPVV